MNYRHFQLDPVTPTIGAMISGIDLNKVRSDEVYEDIKQALWQHNVLFFRKQELQPEAYLRLGAVFGEMEKHEFFPTLAGHPQIQVIANEGYELPDTDLWHTDVTFRKRPNMVSILRNTDLPPQGGDTLWMNTAAAFEALGPALQKMLLGMKAEHDLPWNFRRRNAYERFLPTLAAGRDLSDEAARREAMNDEEIRIVKANPPSIHPAVITHPFTGRRHLFVNSVWTKRLIDVHLDLSQSLLNMLFDWVKRPEFMVRFRWEKDSVAMWDNCATQHYAVFDYAPHYRAGQRITCGSFAPTLDA